MGLKIAQVATSDLSVRLLLLDQIKALESNGHQVTAVCAPGPWVEDVRRTGVTVQTVPMMREISPIADFNSTLSLARLFRQNKFDVVHTHTPKAGLIGPVAGRLARIPNLVHTVHGLLFHDRMSRLHQTVYWIPEKVTATLCDHLLSQSREDMERAVRSRLCARKKIAYLGNGIDVAHFAPHDAYDDRAKKLREVGLRETDFVVGSVGRLVKEKGFMELFAAAETLSARCPQIKFVVIGPREKDQNDALDPDYIEELQRRGVVRFVNWCDDMRPWYSAMDVFVLPSYREGIPRACMEAAAMMRPIVASDIRGCREVVLNGSTGLLVPPRDVPRLISAVEQLQKDSTSAAEMGRRARQHIVQNFNIRDVCKRLCDFYAQLDVPKESASTREEPAYH
ncbi:MAG TPA: glycosyltransferase family 4 protein [Candidatus Sulfotelmatobacter sp.]|nr:glycosyltransferase family 4 protein [Candidatus Sulfotelmatobacter sp.]